MAYEIGSMRHDDIKDTRPGEVYYFAKNGDFTVAKRARDNYNITIYATTHYEWAAVMMAETFKVYEETV